MQNGQKVRINRSTKKECSNQVIEPVKESQLSSNNNKYVNVAPNALRRINLKQNFQVSSIIALFHPAFVIKLHFWIFVLFFFCFFGLPVGKTLCWIHFAWLFVGNALCAAQTLCLSPLPMFSAFLTSIQGEDTKESIVARLFGLLLHYVLFGSSVFCILHATYICVFFLYIYFSLFVLLPLPLPLPIHNHNSKRSATYITCLMMLYQLHLIFSVLHWTWKCTNFNLSEGCVHAEWWYMANSKIVDVSTITANCNVKDAINQTTTKTKTLEKIR